jgi:YD repeat-containing protein
MTALAFAAKHTPKTLRRPQKRARPFEGSVAFPKGGDIPVKDPLGNVSKICYNSFNAPVATTDANGIVTKYEYSDFGSVARMERLDGGETLASLAVSYDGAGRPVSYTDQDGLAKSFDRDAFGRVLKERFPDGSEVGYSYDALGRRTSVIDENGHEIRFGWGRFGLKSRTTAAETGTTCSGSTSTTGTTSL